MESASPERQNPENEASAPELSIGQRRRILSIYEFLARALPTEGRDYMLEFKFTDPEDNDKISIRLHPYTRLGKIWCDYCTEALSSKMGK